MRKPKREGTRALEYDFETMKPSEYFEMRCQSVDPEDIKMNERILGLLRAAEGVDKKFATTGWFSWGHQVNHAAPDNGYAFDVAKSIEALIAAIPEESKEKS